MKPYDPEQCPFTREIPTASDIAAEFDLVKVAFSTE